MKTLILTSLVFLLVVGCVKRTDDYQFTKVVYKTDQGTKWNAILLTSQTKDAASQEIIEKLSKSEHIIILEIGENTIVFSGPDLNKALKEAKKIVK